jgi:ATP-dependent 26S proteasome regulatory subunit
MAYKYPDFITKMNNDYKSQFSHLFILDGNIHDFCDSSGDMTVTKLLRSFYDDAMQELAKEQMVRNGTDSEIEFDNSKTKAKAKRILVSYNLSQGLQYTTEESTEVMKAVFMDQITKEQMEANGGKFMKPRDLSQLANFMNLWFEISKKREIRRMNQGSLTDAERRALPMPVIVTWLIEDADTLIPKARVIELGVGERSFVVGLRHWAQDEWVGKNNRIILMCRHGGDIDASIRSEISTSHTIKKPNFEERLAYIEGINKWIKSRAAGKENKKIQYGDNFFDSINWACGFDARQCAIQSAGMNRKQLKDVFLQSWHKNAPVDYQVVLERKQRAMQEEYEGMVDFVEPTFGFEEIGGNEHFKEYAHRKIITPLRNGDVLRCSRGALMLGPPGTGKSTLAQALAKEAKMNFIQLHLGKLFGGIVGDTERNTRKMIEAIEAASPCIGFIDEIDSVLSSGRSSPGDSGTSARVFNSVMTLLSDPARTGKVVILAASNRPDLLDPALIRDQRFDARLPILPPAPTDREGRTLILKAMKIKHKANYSKELTATINVSDNGLGRLVMDTSRMWTGAEIETLVRESIDTAYFAGRESKDIQLEDWNQTMDDVISNTRSVVLQTKLALFFCSQLRYVPIAFRDQAADKQTLYNDLIEAGVDPRKLS